MWLVGLVTAVLMIENVTVYTKSAEAEVINNLPEKITELENEVMADLASCETRGVNEPDAAIILDTNDAMSIGRYMYQIRTVQHYAHVFYDVELSRKEAIQVAIDAHPDISLDDMTRKVIFEDSKGIDNWYNCNVKLGLEAKIEIIKSLRQ